MGANSFLVKPISFEEFKALEERHTFLSTQLEDLRQHEIIPLDSAGEPPYEQNQLYINSGTWRSYYDLAIKNPAEQKFIPYETLTYMTFYKDDEREGRLFETWSGAYA